MNQKQNDFDHWIRKLADEAESPFHEASWLKMEELLDNKKKKRIFWWILPLGITSVLMIAGLIYFFNGSNETLNTNNVVVSSNSNPQPESILKVAENQSSISNTIKYTILNAFDETTTEKGIIEKMLIDKNTASNLNASTLNKVFEKSNLTQENSNSINSNVKKNTTSGQRSSAQRSNLNTKQENQGINTKAVFDKAITRINSNDQSKTLIDDEVKDNPVSQLNDIESSHKMRSLLKANALFYTWPMLTGKTNRLQMPDVPNTFPKPKSKVYSAIVLSVHGSPEITTVPSRSYGSTSKEYGFNISYQFTPHLSLSTGLQKTNKLYSAKQGDYEIANSDYLSNKVIENIDAVCKVVEWPITVGYKFRMLGNNYFQLNAGLASIRMDKENYSVDYSYYKGGRVNRKVYPFDNKNWEMWSAAVFSITYTKPIAKHLSFSLSPYLKTPLKGIGNGNVDLRSIGSQIGLNYSIPTLRKN